MSDAKTKKMMAKVRERVPCPFVEPSAEDKALLRYAGALGHPYVLIGGEDGKRRVHVESSWRDSILSHAKDCPRSAVYEHRGRRWVRIGGAL